MAILNALADEHFFWGADTYLSCDKKQDFYLQKRINTNVDWSYNLLLCTYILALYMVYRLMISHIQPTWGLPQVWLDGRSISSFAKPNFSSGWTNNFELQFLTSTKQLNQQWLLADGMLIPHLTASPGRCRQAYWTPYADWEIKIT